METYKMEIPVPRWGRHPEPRKIMEGAMVKAASKLVGRWLGRIPKLKETDVVQMVSFRRNKALDMVLIEYKVTRGKRILFKT